MEEKTEIKEKIDRMMKELKEADSIDGYLDEMVQDLVAKYVVVSHILEVGSESKGLESLPIEEIAEVIYPVSIRTYEENVSALVDAIVSGDPDEKNAIKPLMLFHVASKMTVDYISALSHKLFSLRVLGDSDDVGYA